MTAPQLHFARPAPTVAATPRMGISVLSLIGAMDAERGFIHQLVTLMRAQREAVARDSIGDIDDSVFATHRLLATLTEARKHRQEIMAHLCERSEPSIYELEVLLGRAMTPALATARDALRDAARELSSEVAINKSVLKHAMAAGESMMRVLTGQGPTGVAAGALTYGERGEATHGTTTAPETGRLLNRRA